MNGDEAETRLREQNSDCCYLTRYSEARDELTLSVLRRKQDDHIFQNFDIVGEPEDEPTNFEILGTERKFCSLRELLDYYNESDNPLNHNIDGIGDAVKCEKILSTEDASIQAPPANGKK